MDGARAQSRASDDLHASFVAQSPSRRCHAEGTLSIAAQQFFCGKKLRN
jgi:hypothetical protein